MVTFIAAFFTIGDITTFVLAILVSRFSPSQVPVGLKQTEIGFFKFCKIMQSKKIIIILRILIISMLHLLNLLILFIFRYNRRYWIFSLLIFFRLTWLFRYWIFFHLFFFRLAWWFFFFIFVNCLSSYILRWTVSRIPHTTIFLIIITTTFITITTNIFLVGFLRHNI